MPGAARLEQLGQLPHVSSVSEATRAIRSVPVAQTWTVPSWVASPRSRVLGRAFEELQRDVAERRRSVLDAYGATSPAEVFAVATESFLEEPELRKRDDPQLHEVLARFYGVEP